MATGQEIHLGDIGTIFRLQLTDCGTPVDLSLATSLVFCFQPPSPAALFSRTATFAGTPFVGDGTDGGLQYTAVNSDLHVIGDWEIQARVVIPSGTFHSAIGSFEVLDNLCT